jgi:alkylation response protein AidB-like acyl-CoA dehydrogenase
MALDFSFTEEQNLLRNSVQRFVRERYDFAARGKALRSEAGWRPQIWKEFAELGLLGLAVPEDFGGLGGGPIEAMIVMEEFGRALVVEPYLSTAIIGVNALAHAGSKVQREEWLPLIASGEAIVAFAYAEPQARFDLADLSTTAKPADAGFRLNGHKIAVVGAPMANYLIVSARTSGGQRDKGGVTLFWIPKATKGVSTRDYPTVDGARASDVTFENVYAPRDWILGELDAGLALISQVADEAIAALCAEAIGAMKALNDQTTEYTKTRQQFGQPIGRFQVIQHRLVDMFMACEQSVSITYMATLKLGDAAHARTRAASAAKAQIGKAGRFIGQSAVHLHGGMGMTDELSVGHYFKRLTMIDTMFGNADHHVRRFAALDEAA